MQEVITHGSRAVVINGDPGAFWANLYVNARDGIHNAQICRTTWKGKTLAGAHRWADVKLERTGGAE